MMKYTYQEAAYIRAGRDSGQSREVILSKLRFCIRCARQYGRDVWKRPHERIFYQDLKRSALVDARYWQAALRARQTHRAALAAVDSIR